MKPRGYIRTPLGRFDDSEPLAACVNSFEVDYTLRRGYVNAANPILCHTLILPFDALARFLLACPVLYTTIDTICACVTSLVACDFPAWLAVMYLRIVDRVQELCHV